MRRNTTFARGSAIPAATLNAVQDEQAGLIRATSSNGAPALTGADGRHWCTPDAGVADGYVAVIDATPGLDWRARLVWGTWARLETASQRLQGADAWQGNDVTRPIARKIFHGRTGTGAKGAADATVDTGVPPVVASGSFAVVVDELDSSSHRVWLYADPDDGSLCLYNASGATLHGELLVHGAGLAPVPGSPPPSPIPTLTDVLWLDPGLAADRPADPGGPAIYCSTDTGAVEIWDGGAWRSMGVPGLLWLDPGLAADRPADPGGPAIYCSTDTGAVEIWDGGAWRSMGVPGRLTSAPGLGTGDDTWTTAITITPTGSSMLTLDVAASALRSDGARGGAWRFSAAFRTPASSTPVQVGDTVFVLATADDLSGGAPVWAVRAHVSGASVLLQVRGALATNIKWRLEATVTEVRA